MTPEKDMYRLCQSYLAMSHLRCMLADARLLSAGSKLDGNVSEMDASQLACAPDSCGRLMKVIDEELERLKREAKK